MKLGTARPHIASYNIIRKGNKIAFVLRSNTGWMDNYYGLISGKVEKNEPYVKAAVREAKEEAGIDVKPEHAKLVLTMHRYEPSDQAVDWVDLFFEVSKWQGEVTNAEPHMHSEMVWLDPAKLPENVIPCVKFALDQIEKGNNYAEYGWEK